MKILINYLGRNNSGPVIAIEMAKGFLNCGNQVSAIISDETSNIKEWEKLSDRIDLHKIHTYSSKKEFALNTFGFMIHGKSKIYDELGNKRYDMIVNPMHHLWSTLICDCFDCRIVTVCHDPIPHEGESKLETYLTHKLMKKSDDIVVLTKAFVPIVKEKFNKQADHIYYMPHGILNNYKNCRTNERIFTYSKKNWHLLFFGRIEEYKGIEIILKAFQIIENNRDDIDLTIAGKGEMSKYAVFLESNNIVVHNDYIPDENVADFFDGENIVVVLPYITASQSGVVAVSLDFDNYVIASNVGGLREQLGDGEAGIFVEPGNPYDLAEKIQQLVDDEALQVQQKEAIRKLRTKLDWNTIIKKLNDNLIDMSGMMGE